MTSSLKPKLFFLGLHQGHGFKPKHLFRIERRRAKESRAALGSGLFRQVFSVEKADLIFLRNRPEHTTDSHIKSISEILGSRSSRALVINSISNFLNHDSKDRSFTLWQSAGLHAPEHIVVEDVEELQKFLAEHSEILLRTNNETGSMGMLKLDISTHSAELTAAMTSLSKRVTEARKTRHDTKLLAVEYLPPEKDSRYHDVFRAHIVGDRVLSYYATTSRGIDSHGRTMEVDVFEHFVELNEQLHQHMQNPEFANQVKHAVKVIGCGVGAIDFLIRDNKPYFLEVNPIWGVQLQRKGFGDLQTLIDSDRPSLETRIPMLFKFLSPKSFYYDMYSELRTMTLSHMESAS